MNRASIQPRSRRPPRKASTRLVQADAGPRLRVSDVSDLCRLLRACRGRPRGGNTAKQHDEVAAPHGAYPSAEDDNLPRCQWTARLYAWSCHPLLGSKRVGSSSAVAIPIWLRRFGLKLGHRAIDRRPARRSLSLTFRDVTARRRVCAFDHTCEISECLGVLRHYAGR
jgi:hypothetical protein